VKAGLTGLPPGEASGAFPEISWSGPNPPDAWRANGGARAFDDALALKASIKVLHEERRRSMPS